MVFIPITRHGRIQHRFGRASLSRLLYGRVLALPSPPPTMPQTVPPALSTDLAPFARRLFRQRLALTILHLSCAAASAILLLSVLRLAGLPLPLPAAPVAAILLAVAVGALAVTALRPPLAQVAYLLDDRLEAHEVIGSAVEIAAGDSRLGPFLHAAAIRTLRGANAQFVLPWPQLRPRLFLLGALVVSALIGSSIAVHSTSPTVVAAPHAATTQPHPPTTGLRSLRPTAHPIHLPPLAHLAAIQHLAVAVSRPVARSAPNSAPGRQLSPAPTGSTSSPVGHAQGTGGLRVERASTLGPSTASGGTQSGATGAGAPGAHTQRSGGQGRGQGSGAPLHVTFSNGKNSSAGGVGSSQQSLLNLRNTLQGTSQQGASSVAQGSSNGHRNAASGKGSGANSHGTPGGRAPNALASPQNGARRAQSRQMGTGAGSLFGQSSAANGQRGANGSSDPLLGRRGLNPGGGATGAQNTGGSNGDAASQGTAQLSTGGQITLNGATNAGGRLLLRIGPTDHAPTLNGGSLLGVNGNATITVPGYVAPDSNDVAPADQAVVRSYFTPND